MKEHVRMRIQNLGSMVHSILQNDPAGLGSEQLMQKCDHLSSATSATSEVESFETNDDGSPISVREVLSVSAASCSSSDGSSQRSGTGGGRQNGLPSVPFTSVPIAGTGSSREAAAKSAPASPYRRKSRNHLRSYQTTYKGRGSANGANTNRRDDLRSSLQQQKLHAQKDLALSPPFTLVSPATAAPMPKTRLSRAVTAPEPKLPSSLVPITKLARSSSSPDDQAVSNQVDLVEVATRSVKWSSTASVRTIDPADAASRTSADDSSIPSTSNSSALGSTQSRASTSSRPSSFHVKQRRTLQEIRDEVERIQKARAAQAASTKPPRRSTKNRTTSIISNLPEEYSVPITDEAREGKLAARIPGDNASNTSSSEPLTTACESFKSCSSNISQLSTVPFAAMDTAVVSGLRISTTKGIGSDAASNQTAERAKKFLEEEREKERKYQRQKEKRNQKKKPSSSPPTVREGTSAEQSRKGSKKQPHPRTDKKGKNKVAPIIWGDGIVQVLQEQLHHETEEDDATAATSTTTDTAGARTKLRPVEEDAAGASKRKDEMTAAATACKSVWSIQSDATRVVDNRTTFAQTHFTRTV